MWRGAAVRAVRGIGSSRAASGAAAAQLRRWLEGELEGIRGAGTWKSERVIASRQGPHLWLAGGGAGACGAEGESLGAYAWFDPCASVSVCPQGSSTSAPTTTWGSPAIRR